MAGRAEQQVAELVLAARRERQVADDVVHHARLRAGRVQHDSADATGHDRERKDREEDVVGDRGGELRTAVVHELGQRPLHESRREIPSPDDVRRRPHGDVLPERRAGYAAQAGAAGRARGSPGRSFPRHAQALRLSDAWGSASASAASSWLRRKGFITWATGASSRDSSLGPSMLTQRTGSCGNRSAEALGLPQPNLRSGFQQHQDRALLPRSVRAGRSVCDRAAGEGARAATGSQDQDPRSERSPRSRVSEASARSGHGRGMKHV